MDHTPTQTPSPERPANNELFDTARNDFYRATMDVYDTLDDLGVDIDSLAPLRLWSKAVQQAIFISKTEFTSPETAARGAMLELTAQVPLYFMVDKLLGKPGVHRSREDQMRLKHVASSFMRRIRTAGETCPDLSTNELTDHLVQTLAKTGITHDARYYEDLFASCVRGAQHELAAGQILSKLGKVRGATSEEDLQGIDYILQYNNALLPIDIKSSPMKIRRISMGTSDTVAIDKSILVLYSHLTNEDLNDKFEISDDVADEKSWEIAEALRTVDTSKLLIPAKV